MYVRAAYMEEMMVTGMLYLQNFQDWIDILTKKSVVSLKMLIIFFGLFLTLIFISLRFSDRTLSIFIM